MTGEEIKDELYRMLSDVLNGNGPIRNNAQRGRYREAVKSAIEAVEQKICEDEYIKVPKKALKYRTAGMVAYNAEWLKNHFDLERAVICGEQQPCDDATLKDIFCMGCEYKEPCDKCVYSTSEGCQYDDITEAIPPVDPQPKTGYWIEDAGTYYKAIHERGCEPDENTPIFLDDIACSECLAKFSVIDNETERFKCCPHCGAKMVEPQAESEGEK